MASLALLQAPQPAPLDLMDQGCGWFAGTDDLSAKPLQIMAIGYLRGYLDASAHACDQVNNSAPFCSRLRAAQVSGDVFMPDSVAQAVTTYCRRRPDRTFGDAMRQFMMDKGVLDVAPVGKR